MCTHSKEGKNTKINKERAPSQNQGRDGREKGDNERVKNNKTGLDANLVALMRKSHPYLSSICY